MAQNNTFKMNAEVKDSLAKFLARVEGTTDQDGKISVVRNGDSGLSVGRIQVDLSKHPDFAAKLFKIGQEKGLEKADDIKESMLTLKHEDLKDKNKKYDDDKIKKIEKFMTSVLDTTEGKAALKEKEDTHIANIVGKVEQACGQAGPNAKKFCDSPEGQRELASYIHQFASGNIDELKTYLRGEEATIGKNGNPPAGTKVKLNGELTVEGFRTNYRAKTLYGQNHPRPLATRDENVKAANEAFPIAVPQPEKPKETPDAAKPEQKSELEDATVEQPAAVATEKKDEQTTALAEAEPATPQTASQSLAQPLPKGQRRPGEPEMPRPPFNFLDPTMKSPRYDLPSGLAALLGIPHAPGGGGDIDGDFAALAKQVGGDGLPPLVSDLLGAGVSRTNPKSAVKLFQTTINALNKPDAFDWNWSTSGKIDVDGDLGPQTRAGFGRALEKAGPEGFARKFALGQFRDYATRLDNGIERYENLAGAVDGSLGHVDRNAAANFQDYLNAARDNLPPHVRYEGLKRDGWIGPKTTDAFKTALYNLGPKTIADDLEGLFVA